MKPSFEPDDDGSLGDLRPPTPAELAFDEYLDLVNAGNTVDTAAFVEQRPDAQRLELESLIDDWNGVRSHFGGEEDLLPGSCAGGYRALSLLGRGGMGSVYAADHPQTGRHVALKVLSKEHRYSDEAWARFEREARLAAGINHPRCVFVYGLADFDGRSAIAMERMTGGSLQDEIASGDPLPVERAVDLTLQVLEGINAAHETGILHRDVKPANCFHDGAGGVKIGDFGIARCLTREDALTNTGQFLGSPLYAAPEQMRGDEVDARTDVYSVGATLFALVTGRPPFEGKGLGEVISRVLADPVPSARRLNSAVPRNLDRVIRRALDKSPGSRQASAMALIEALQPFATGSEQRRKQEGLAGRLEGSHLPAVFRWISTFIEGSEHEYSIHDTDYARSEAHYEEMGRFWLLGRVAPTVNGTYFLAHDGELERRLWVHIYREGFTPGPPLVSNQATLRWIEDGVEDGRTWRAFEDPGGVPLKTYKTRRTPIPWPRLRENLVRLCENLLGNRPVQRTTELWVDRQGDLRVLECALDRDPGDIQEGRSVLQQVSSAFLTERGTEKDLRPGYAASIQELQRQLIDPALRFDSVAQAKAALEGESSSSSGLSRQQRLGPLLPTAFGLAFCLVMRFWLNLSEEKLSEGEYATFLLTALGLLVAFPTAIAFAFRSSVWCLLAGMELRSVAGGPPARWRCALRALLTSSTVSLAFFFVGIVHIGEIFGQVYYSILLSSGYIAVLAIVGFPSQTAVDRIVTGTYVVGRSKALPE